MQIPYSLSGKHPIFYNVWMDIINLIIYEFKIYLLFAHTNKSVINNFHILTNLIRASQLYVNCFNI